MTDQVQARPEQGGQGDHDTFLPWEEGRGGPPYDRRAQEFLINRTVPRTGRPFRDIGDPPGCDRPLETHETTPAATSQRLELFAAGKWFSEFVNDDSNDGEPHHRDPGRRNRHLHGAGSGRPGISQTSALVLRAGWMERQTVQQGLPFSRNVRRSLLGKPALNRV